MIMNLAIIFILLAQPSSILYEKAPRHAKQLVIPDTEYKDFGSHPAYADKTRRIHGRAGITILYPFAYSCQSIADGVNCPVERQSQ